MVVFSVVLNLETAKWRDIILRELPVIQMSSGSSKSKPTGIQIDTLGEVIWEDSENAVLEIYKCIFVNRKK